MDDLINESFYESIITERNLLFKTQNKTSRYFEHNVNVRMGRVREGTGVQCH